MNFKINLWTLLFAITFGGLVYMYYSKSSEKIGEPDNPTIQEPQNPISEDVPKLLRNGLLSDNLDDCTISNEEARARFINYNSKFYNYANLVAGAPTAPLYFRLEKKLITEILNSHPEWQGKQVYAVLGIKNSAVDLMFSNVEPNSGKTMGDGEFYDFSRPCPPTCDQTDSNTHEGSDELGSEEFLSRYLAYIYQFETPLVMSTFFKNSGIDAVPIYFRLHENLMLSILNDHPEWQAEEVYAIMSIKGNMIDLMFSNVEPNSGKDIWEGEFYDFSRPCPPTCDPT